MRFHDWGINTARSAPNLINQVFFRAECSPDCRSGAVAKRGTAFRVTAKDEHMESFQKSNIRTFSTQKEGNLPDEYEDASAYGKDGFLFSVTDGATESSFAKEWAKFLAEEFTENSDSEEHGLRYVLRNAITKAKIRWNGALKNKTIPWHAEEKVKRGAYASFIGLKIFPETMKWEAISVGDCCLFVVRNDKLAEKFPIEDPEEFGNTPYLIGSVADPDEDGIKVKQGALKGGDVIFLFSDAFAHWFLRTCENEPWKKINGIKDKTTFQSVIDELRENREMKNDDVTMMTITVPQEV